MAELRKKLQNEGLLDKPTAKSWTKLIALMAVVGVLYAAHILLPLKYLVLEATSRSRYHEHDIV